MEHYLTAKQKGEVYALTLEIRESAIRLVTDGVEEIKKKYPDIDLTSVWSALYPLTSMARQDLKERES
ncbi:MAG: hypothetical protein D4S01_03615 [Dehalococcoidia bacterium]|nr:MAG: hypothetical protein D4S01_03615 [Dehalococcoidia bacterium]